MAKFNYVLTDKTGRKEEGSMRADNKDIVLKKLAEKNKIILSVIEAPSHGFFSFLSPKASLSFQDKMLFVTNLSMMIKVGVTVTEALQIIMDQSKQAGVKKLYQDLIEMIRSGQSLGKSLEKYDYIFSKLFINMIITGEESGNLEMVLDYLNVQMEKAYEIRKKVISALIYPAIIIGITIIMGIGIVVFIMPKITKVFESFDIVLPLPTRMLIGSSAFVTGNPLLMLAMVIGFVVFGIFIFKSRTIKPIMDRIFLRIPVFSGILVAANVARFSRTLNSLLQSSVPVTDALRITAEMLDNTVYETVLNEAAEKVEKGGQLGDSLENNERLFPVLAVKMLAIGEKTGSLETTTEKVAELYEKTVDAKTKNLSVLLEPILLVFMSALVGGIALSIILPIYQLPNLLGK